MKIFIQITIVFCSFYGCVSGNLNSSDTGETYVINFEDGEWRNGKGQITFYKDSTFQFVVWFAPHTDSLFYAGTWTGRLVNKDTVDLIIDNEKKEKVRFKIDKGEVERVNE